MFLKLLAVLVVGQLQGSYCTVTTTGNLAILEGQSVTVPCHYNPQYTSHVKYWCQGLMKDFCTSLARTDNPESAPNGNGRVTIADDPTQHVFTVSMRDLMKNDSGWYWCGVEIGGMWTSDSTASLYISVDQGVSVLNSMVSADEGSSISVQSIYSQNLRSNEKRWCRSGDLSSCVVTNSNGTFSGRNLIICDDRKSVFTVTLQHLEMRDSGWYWLGAGQHQVAVRVSVTPRATKTTTSLVQILRSTAALPVIKSNDSHSNFQSPLIVCGVVLLVITAFLVIWKLRQQYKNKHKHRWTREINDNLTMGPWKEVDYKSTSVIFLNSPAPAGAHVLMENVPYEK